VLLISGAEAGKKSRRRRKKIRLLTNGTEKREKTGRGKPSSSAPKTAIERKERDVFLGIIRRIIGGRERRQVSMSSSKREGGGEAF